MTATSKGYEPKIDLADYLRRICGVDLTQVIGLNVLSVLLIVSEIGVDMSKCVVPKPFLPGLAFVPAIKSALSLFSVASFGVS